MDKFVTLLSKCPTISTVQTQHYVSQHLNHHTDFGYQIRRIYVQSHILEYLMQPTTTGKYLCILTDLNFAANHAVGIDCDHHPKFIYDCCEETALYLCPSNMDKCVGVDETFMKIQYIGEIIKYGESNLKH